MENTKLVWNLHYSKSLIVVYMLTIIGNFIVLFKEKIDNIFYALIINLIVNLIKSIIYI